MRELPLALAVLSAAVSARAQTHSLDVRISDGKAVYTHAEKLVYGQQANYVGPAAGSLGSRRTMIVNVLLGGTSAEPGWFTLEYQLELSGGRGSPEPMVQAQGTLRMRAGARVTALECGAWTVELGLDAAPAKKKGPAAPFDDGGLGNFRVTADLARGRSQLVCRHVIQAGTQGNVVEGFSRGGRKYGFIFNSLLQRDGGSFVLQYQLEQSPMGLTTLQVQNTESLTLGRRSSSEGNGYKLGFLAEGAAPTEAKPAAPAAKPGAGQAVPLLR